MSDGSITLETGRLTLSGTLDATSVTTGWSLPVTASIDPDAPFVVDLHRMTRCTGTGLAFLHHVRSQLEAVGTVCLFEGLSPVLAEQLAKFRREELELRRHPVPAIGRRIRYLSRIGERAHSAASMLRDTLGYIGELAQHAAVAVRHPRIVRWPDFWLTCERAGADALPVVMLIGFLLGLILAFQSAIPMKMFGAQIYVASLVGISLIRELGPLITAIVLTGRSGSAFAAELGTMQVNEEIDALRTMGLQPVRFLALPRVLAGMCITPLLTIFANLAGLAGGLVVMLSMDYSFSIYYSQLTTFIDVSDLVGGLAKSLVFGLLVSAVGCQRGLETGKDAAAVGRATTSAVVSGIIFIAVADGLFAVLFYAMDW